MKKAYIKFMYASFGSEDKCYLMKADKSREREDQFAYEMLYLSNNIL